MHNKKATQWWSELSGLQHALDSDNKHLQGTCAHWGMLKNLGWQTEKSRYMNRDSKAGKNIVVVNGK